MNRGQFIERLKNSGIINPKVVVNTSGVGFKVNYLNPFEAYKIRFGSDKVMHQWNNDPLQLYSCCVNFAVHCSTSALGISLEQIFAKDPLKASIFRFHLYYHVRSILYQLKVLLPQKEAFNQIQTNYDRDAYLDICKDYGVDSELDWRNQYLFSTYQNGRLIQLSNNSWSRWIMPKSNGFTKHGMEMLNESIRVYVYCLLSAQSSVRSNIIGNSAPNFEAQKTFVTLLEDFVKRDMLLHEDISRYENILSNARSSVDYSLAKGLYMLPSDLQLKVASQKRFSDKLKVAGAAVPKLPRFERLSFKEQRVSKNHEEGMQSLLLLGSLAAIALVYLLK